jgi:hypothetical protein
LPTSSVTRTDTRGSEPLRLTGGREHGRQNENRMNPNRLPSMSAGARVYTAPQPGRTEPGCTAGLSMGFGDPGGWARLQRVTPETRFLF